MNDDKINKNNVVKSLEWLSLKVFKYVPNLLWRTSCKLYWIAVNEKIRYKITDIWVMLVNNTTAAYHSVLWTLKDLCSARKCLIQVCLQLVHLFFVIWQTFLVVLACCSMSQMSHRDQNLQEGFWWSSLNSLRILCKLSHHLRHARCISESALQELKFITGKLPLISTVPISVPHFTKLLSWVIIEFHLLSL